MDSRGIWHRRSDVRTGRVVENAPVAHSDGPTTAPGRLAMINSITARLGLFAIASLISSGFAYATTFAIPICPEGPIGCFGYEPATPNSITPTALTFYFYSGYPDDGMVENLTTQVVGNVVQMQGTYVECDGSQPGCVGHGEPAGPVPFFATLPVLPAGNYTIELRLSADPAYPFTPALVQTANGPVQGSVFVTEHLTIVPGTANEAADVIEFYNTSLNHYFVTSLANEIAILDLHQPPFQDWIRTGFSFKAYVAGTAPSTTAHICRFYNSSYNSHFYAAQGLGCAETQALFPDWHLESPELFNETIPTTAGNCAQHSTPVYRLYNNGMGGAPNHRYLTDLNERQRMIMLGWIPEGYGAGVAMCAP
jgi:hypothetical protein